MLSSIQWSKREMSSHTASGIATQPNTSSTRAERLGGGTKEKIGVAPPPA
jgi:hypothetical protein